MKALAVDDSNTMRKLIVEALGYAGITDVHEASDGMDAVQKCNEHNYDLILMDWNMPTMGGIDAVKALRKMGSQACIIMVTTESEKDRVMEAIKDGVDNYIMKPFQIPTFVEKVKASIGGSSSNSDLPKKSELAEEQERKMVDAKYLEPILEEINGIFDTMLGCELEVKNVGLADGGKRPENIMALIAFSGALKGTIGLSFPKETALAVVNRMLGTDEDHVDELILDGLAELVNIVGGRSKAKFSEKVGEVLNLSLPLVIQGDYIVYCPANTVWTELQYAGELGPFHLKVTTESVVLFA